MDYTGGDFTPTTHHDTYAYIAPESTPHDLSNRAVFISGASKGIGRSTALSFARAGCTYIALGARSPLSSLADELVAAAKSANHPAPKILSIVLDVTSPSSVAAAAEKVKSEFGRLDILINNAGYLEKFLPIIDSDPDEWSKVWDVNLKGVYLVSRSFLPLLIDTKDGLKTMLNVSSVGAHLTMPGASGYQTTKLALLRFTEFVNVECEEQGVLAYCIHPGGVMTELASALPKEAHYMLEDQPELAADSVVWLTGTRREWLRARYVSVTWDMKELEGKKEEIEKGDLLKVRMAVAM